MRYLTPYSLVVLYPELPFAFQPHVTPTFPFEHVDLRRIHCDSAVIGNNLIYDHLYRMTAHAV